jgi:peptide/nickel transport system substrate-binding protein
VLSKKKLSALAAAAAMALALTACGGSGDGNGGSGGGSDSLILGSVFPPTSFAANNVNWANEAPYVQAVYDTLLRATPDGEIEPWLATEWAYNEDNTVLTMQLRDDVTFTDGEPFNAEAAAQNILGFKNGTSANASFLTSVADATATDEFTLQITLTQPDPALLQYLTQNAGVQGSPAAFDAADAQTNPVGSGPYVLDTENTVVGSSYAFTKNPDYWAPDDRHYETLTITVLDNAQTQLNAVQGGQVNALNLLDNTAAEQFEAAGFTLYPHELDWQGLILFDRAGDLAPELGDVKVRQAIAHALDREAILEAAAAGRGTVTGQIFGANSAAYDESLDERYPYDPDEAQKLLADAGYPDGFTLSLPQVPLGTNTVYDLIRQYLGDVGINVEYTQVPLQNAIADIVGAKYPAAFFQLQQDPTVWQTANLSISQAATFNVFHQPDPTVEQLAATIQGGTEEEAAEASRQLNEYVVEQVWFVPFYRLESNFVADENTDVVHQSDNAVPYLWNITPKN